METQAVTRELKMRQHVSSSNSHLLRKARAIHPCRDPCSRYSRSTVLLSAPQLPIPGYGPAAGMTGRGPARSLGWTLTAGPATPAPGDTVTTDRKSVSRWMMCLARRSSCGHACPPSCQQTSTCSCWSGLLRAGAAPRRVRRHVPAGGLSHSQGLRFPTGRS